jgi:hypothetical protein
MSATDHVRRARLVVLLVSAVMLIPKLLVAWRTFGTIDIEHWFDFLHAVHQHGPVGIYGVTFQRSLYNHPPLVGYYLIALGSAQHIGLSFPFVLRAMSCLADVASAILVFEILRRRAGTGIALTAGVAVALSPILFIVSAYHGNTDPVFVMLVLLSAYLLADRSQPVLAGVAVALALGVKIVPVVVLPCLLVYAFTRGRTVLLRFVGAGAVVSLLFWTPALLTEWGPLRQNVLGYAGTNNFEWGLAQIGQWAGQPSWAVFLEGRGRTLIVALCAVLPAVLLWRRPQLIMPAIGLALTGFLALTPTFGTQYLAWGAAPVFLLGAVTMASAATMASASTMAGRPTATWRRWSLALGGGLLFNVLSGVLIFHAYNRWSGGLPWYRATSWGFTHNERIFGIVIWALLLLSLGAGVRQLIQAPRATDVTEPAQPGASAGSTGATRSTEARLSSGMPSVRDNT